MPFALEEAGASYLSSQSEIVSGPGSSTSAPSSSRRAGEHAVVEVGERDDELDAVLGDERARAPRCSPGSSTGGHERAAVGGVQRRRELVQVDRERRRPGAPERLDDVDALPGAGEEDDGHGAEAYFHALDCAACAVPSSHAPRSSPARPARTATTSCGGCSRTAGRCTRPCATSRRPRRSSAATSGWSRCGATSAIPGPLRALVGDVRPEELYNLAGESSVSASFADPQATWESNAHVVVHLLDAIRLDSPDTRFYQASSGEMFGSVPGESVVHDENAPLNPQSPYAAAKAAAHMLCRSYRESYGIRIACGILFNHESRRRGPQFLSRKVVDHVHAPRERGRRTGPLALGNLKAQRDWGFAPDYVDGMIAILRQAEVRGVPDEAPPTATTSSAPGSCTPCGSSPTAPSRSPGFELEWQLDGDDPLGWSARFAASGEPAVVVDPAFIRPSDPQAIAADPRRIEAELGWQPRPGLDRFLEDMLDPSSQ